MGLYDYWVVKLSEDGNIEWQNTAGGANDDFLYCIIQTSDGGYLLGGTSESEISGDKNESSRGGLDFWIVKLDEDGSVSWQNTLGGSGYDWFHSAVQTDDGGFLLGGYTDSGISGDKVDTCRGGFDYWVIKLDDYGEILWQKTLGGSGDDELHVVSQTEDGGYLLGGNSTSGLTGDKADPNLGASDYWVIKIDSYGVIEWQETIGGNGFDILYSFIQTEDNGFLLGGYSTSGVTGNKTEPNLGSFDYWVLKLAGIPTYVPEEVNIQGFMVHPNPTHGNIRCYLMSPLSETAMLRLFSITGEQVLNMQMSLNNGTTSQQIQLSESLPNGVYLLNIQTDTRVFTEQVILQR